MQKKLFSNNRFWFGVWAAYHGAILILFLISLIFTKGIVFDADYTSMMPSATDNKAAKIAEKSVSENANRSIFILASHEDFEKAKEAAQTVYGLLKDEKSKFASLSLYSDMEAVSDVQEFIAKYRFNLLDSKLQKQLESEGGAEEVTQNALASVYSGFSMTSLENIAEDPFLLDESNLKNYLSAVTDSGTKLSPKDGVLAREFEGRWYVMLRGELTEEGAQLASKKNAVPLIYEKCLPLEKDGVRFVFYGTTFHSYKSSSSASSEISLISTVSMLAVVLILLFVFRSPLPVIASVFSIALSMGTAFFATHLIFGQIHLIALVFGTSLIGSCIDYSLHYFINWKNSKELDSPQKIRSHLFNGLSLSLISTELCFLLLAFAPFGMLRQMAVFSFAGMLSSFLTVSGFYTLFKLPPAHKRGIALIRKWEEKPQNPSGKLYRYAGAVFSLLIFVVSSAVLLVRHDDVKIQNNIANLYKMEGRLKEDTVTAYKVLGYNPTSWLVVSGDTVEEVLQTEEKLATSIPDKFICTSRFIPSAAAQKKSAEAAERLVPFAAGQFEYLGFEGESEEYARDFTLAVEEAKKNIITPEEEMPATLRPLLNMLYIGRVEDRYYSIILPSAISDEAYYQSLADTYPNVYYENKVREVSAGLDNLTRLILIMFGIAFVVIAVIMKFFYSWRDTLRIISIPVLSILSIVAVFVLAGLKIEFFCITGVILVFGLGLDYIIYRTQNKTDRAEMFAIFLSFVTTAISFGALALSSFVPVHVIGLSIFSGLTTAFLCAIL